MQEPPFFSEDIDSIIVGRIIAGGIGAGIAGINAIRKYKEAINLQPEYIVAINNLGHVYEKKKLVPQALEAYQQVLAIAPDNETAKRRAESLKKRVA
jgi:tetratricopeptide (TPR) repeat protein